MLAFCSACSIFLTFATGNYFFFVLLQDLFTSPESLFEYNENFLFKMKHEGKFLICLSLLLNFQGNTVKRMFSRYFLSVYYLLDFSPIKQTYFQTCVKRSPDRSLKNDRWCYAKLLLWTTTTSDGFRRKNVFYFPEPLYRVTE